MANNTNLVARIILRLQDDASRGLDNARQHVGGIGQEIDRVKQLLIGLFSFIAIKEGLEKLVGLSDKFANLSARIKLATSSTQEYNSAQSELFNIAQRSRTAWDSVVALYAKVQIGIKELGGGQKMAFSATEAITRAFKISGATAAEAAGAIQQFTQSIVSGVFRGEEFNSVMEQGPRLAQALADGLGVARSALRKMADAGELTTDRVIAALLSQKDKLAAEYALLPQTVASAWQQLTNQFERYVGQSKGAKDATKNIADGIAYVTEHLDTFMSIAIRSAEMVAGIFAARKIAGLFAFTQGLLTARAASTALSDAAVAGAARAAAAATSAATAIALAAERAGASAALAATTAGAILADVAAAAGVAASNAALAAGATVTEAAEAASLAASTAARAAGASAVQAANAGAVAAEAAAVRIRTAAGVASEAAVSGLGAVGAGLSRLVGGPLGVAALVFYALYESVQKLTGAEEKAAVKSKALADALSLMHTEVKELSGAEIDIDLSKTNASIDGLEQKISDLGWSRIWTVGFHGVMEINKQIDNLEQGLDVLKQRKDALVAKKNEDIINFDSSKLSAEELNAELVATKTKIDEIHQRVDPLKKQLDDGLIGSEAVNDDLKLLNAYESKFEQLAKKSGDSSFEVYQLRQSLNTIPEAANALAQGIDTALAGAKKAAIQHANELIETAKDSAGKTHKPYDDAAKAITQSFQDSTQAIDTELKQQLENIKLNAANEEVEIDATAQAFRDAERDKTAAVENTKTELERVWNETYGTAIEVTRKAGGDIEQLEKDGAEARIAALQTVVDAYQASISTMIDEEHRLLAEIKATDEYRLNIQTSIEDKIRESQRKTLSDEAAYADEHNQIYEKIAQADYLRRNGELDAARKTAEEALRLADSHDRVLKDASDNAVKRALEAEAKAKASADKVAEYSFAGGNADEKRMAAQAKRIDAAADKVAAAHEKVIEAQRKQAEEQEAQERRHIETATLYQKILESLDATAAQRQEKLQGAADGFFGDIDGTKKKLSALKDMIQGIQDQVSKKSDIKLKLGADEALKDVEKLKALLAAKELAVKIKADPANADKEVAELTQRLRNANVSVPAAIAFEQIRNEEINKVTEPLDKALSEPHTVKVNADDAVKKAGDVGQAVTAATQPRKLTILTAEAEAEMNRMLAEIAKAKEPQQIQVDAADATGKVAALGDQVAAIPKNTITRLDVDGNPLSTKIIGAKGELDRLPKNSTTRLDVNTEQAVQHVDRLRNTIENFKSIVPADGLYFENRANWQETKGDLQIMDESINNADMAAKKLAGTFGQIGNTSIAPKGGEYFENRAAWHETQGDLQAIKSGMDEVSGAATELNDALGGINSPEPVALDADNSSALAAVNDLQSSVDQLHGKTIYNTVVTQYVEQHAAGGPIGFLATGGPVSGPGFRRVTGPISGPGTGTSDDVPIMASNGEFMVKTAAVNYYGTEFMNAVNNMQFPRLTNYATGGAIANSPVAAPANMSTPQMDTINLVFHFGAKAIPVQTNRSLALDLAVQLRSLARAS